MADSQRDGALARAIGVMARETPGAALVALGALFGGAKAPAPPPPPPITPMPDLSDPAILAAKNRVLDAAAARSGRASTILSGQGADYGSTKLGAA